MKKTITIISVVAIVAILAVTLMACIPSDYNKAYDNLKEANYYATTYKKGDLFFNEMSKLIGAQNATAIVTASKGTDAITLIYFESSKDAKNCFDSFKNVIEEEKKEAEKNGEDTSNYVIKCSGKIIYGGTKQAVKDAQ